ncbi:Rho protein GDP-dissociation inhibitor [Dillenia turbinata]|uniref:Rho protein GDP-dissociation inhibitor n=1 Tax=Dillenia turbinata TaxID=194707 RepID=A0AAN8VEY6_9MAGN
MSLAIGVVSSSKSDMGYDDKSEEIVVGVEGNEKEDKVDEVDTVTKIPRNMSGSSLYTTDVEEDDEDVEGKLQLENLEPDVKILTLVIKSPGRPDNVLAIPEDGKPKGVWFTLKEGSRYSLKFTFQVTNNIVSGLKCVNTVWKTGVKVDSSKNMLGTFSPQPEPYTHELPEDTTPSGILVRGSYSAKTKFLDDDRKCYLEINYTFDIRRDWH